MGTGMGESGSALDSQRSQDRLTGLPGTPAALAWLEEHGRNGFVHAMLIGLHRIRSVNLAYGPSRPEAAILVILENTSGTGWLLLTIAHARNDVPLR